MADAVDVLIHRPAVDDSAQAQGPTECTTPVRESNALRGGVHPCTSSGETVTRIDDDELDSRIRGGTRGRQPCDNA
nr:hypothetical protein [Jatrophihabitans sp. GAS493]